MWLRKSNKFQNHVGIVRENHRNNEWWSVHFHVSRAVNKQNFWYWSQDYTRHLHELVTIWCWISKFGVIGTYTSLKGKMDKVSQVILNVVWKCFGISLNQNCAVLVLIQKMLFLQDGVSVHTLRLSWPHSCECSCSTLSLLEKNVSHSWLSHRTFRKINSLWLFSIFNS